MLGAISLEREFTVLGGEKGNVLIRERQTSIVGKDSPQDFDLTLNRMIDMLFKRKLRLREVRICDSVSRKRHHSTQTH